MTGLLQVLHAGALGILFLAAIAGPGTVAARRLGLGAAFALPLGFGCVALAGIVSFCAWWIAPAAGNAVSLAVLLGAFALVAARAANASSHRELREAAPVLLATALLTAAWIVLTKAAGVPASSRFTWVLPIDDQLPRMFADRIAAGVLSGPIEGDWLMSDRPPLLTGVLLLFRPLGGGGGLPAETIATLCQLIWLPALVSLGQSLALGWRRIATGVFFAATSGFFLLHSVYTWPKLMAAALFITAVAVVIESMRAGTAKPLRIAAATGTLLSLAVLAHGGVWFSVLALPALPHAWRALRWFGMRGVVVLLLVAVAVSVPWAAFKRYVDPPGNRLVKWHLAGAIDVDDRSSLEAIRDAYARTPVADLWHTRVVNAQFAAGVLGRNPKERWGDYIRRLQFFHFVPAVGLPLLGVGWVLVARLRGRKTDADAAGLIAHAAGTVFVWIALIFQLGGTIVHAGSYVPIAVLIFIGGAAMGRWHTVALACAALVHVTVFLVGWIITTPPADGARVSVVAMMFAATLTAGALAVPALQALRESRRISAK